MIVTISGAVARFFKVSHPHIPSNQPVNVGYSVCFGGSAALVGGVAIWRESLTDFVMPRILIITYGIYSNNPLSI